MNGLKQSKVSVEKKTQTVGGELSGSKPVGEMLIAQIQCEKRQEQVKVSMERRLKQAEVSVGGREHSNKSPETIGTNVKSTERLLKPFNLIPKVLGRSIVHCTTASGI